MLVAVGSRTVQRRIGQEDRADVGHDQLPWYAEAP